jgi:hypothetical protein
LKDLVTTGITGESENNSDWFNIGCFGYHSSDIDNVTEMIWSDLSDGVRFVVRERLDVTRVSSGKDWRED